MRTLTTTFFADLQSVIGLIIICTFLVVVCWSVCAMLVMAAISHYEGVRGDWLREHPERESGEWEPYEETKARHKAWQRMETKIVLLYATIVAVLMITPLASELYRDAQRVQYQREHSSAHHHQ
jgi:hypothetical protein